MASLPQLIEEDVQQLDTALRELLTKSEAAAAVVIDKGGFLIAQAGDTNAFDMTTLAALAAASFAATQGIASLVSEHNFSSIYQQGETHSMLVQNVDEYCLLVVIFKAHMSVGVVKYYAASTIPVVMQQMKAAHERAPDEGLDLSMINVADTADLFRKKQ
jgi:predicted regulator of Ras-like GTPase activity (Roadblock/LC7/MglB family)